MCYKIDNIKYFLIICVLFGHLSNFSSSFKVLYTGIYAFHMPAFIFISGLLLKSSREDKEKMKAHFLSYFSIFILWQFIEILMFGKFHSILDFFTRPRYGMWYLLVLCIYLPVTYFLRKNNPKFILIFSIFIGLIVGFIDVSPLISRMLVFYPFYILGQIVDWKEIWNKNFFWNKLFILLLPLTMLIPVFILKGNVGYNSVTDIIYRMLWYIESTLTFFGIFSIIPPKKYSWTKYGKNTISIYLFHLIICKIMYGLGLRNNIDEFLLICIGILILIVFQNEIFVKIIKKGSKYIENGLNYIWKILKKL